MPIAEQSILSVSLGTVAIVLISILAGYGLGRRRVQHSGDSPEGPVGSVVGSVLGLLAFMLAFTFSIAANRFDTRKQLLLEEVNAIGTAALRAELLPEPHRTACHDLLKQYVDKRLLGVQNLEVLPQMLKECEDLQHQLWRHAVTLARADMNSDIGALFVEAMNEVIDLHTSRVVVGMQYRIPTIIWTVLALLTAMSMVGVGYQFGLAGRTRIAISLVLACSFSLVVTLIADLDRGGKGILKVSQTPMQELQQKLAAPAHP